jgi:hypothetical protein
MSVSSEWHAAHRLPRCRVQFTAPIALGHHIEACARQALILLHLLTVTSAKPLSLLTYFLSITHEWDDGFIFKRCAWAKKSAESSPCGGWALIAKVQAGSYKACFAFYKSHLQWVLERTAIASFKGVYKWEYWYSPTPYTHTHTHTRTRTHWLHLKKLFQLVRTLMIWLLGPKHYRDLILTAIMNLVSACFFLCYTLRSSEPSLKCASDNCTDPVVWLLWLRLPLSVLETESSIPPPSCVSNLSLSLIQPFLNFVVL